MTRVASGSVRRTLLPQGLVLGGVAAGALLVAFRDPNESGHYPSCPFLAMTGYYCPGCGMMRLVHALAHGDVGTAFGFNPLVFVLLPVFGYMFVRWTVLGARGMPMRSALFRPVVVYSFVGVLAVYWVVRNLPFAEVLAP
ncbi:DUF2752 domain-containing protein [Actinomadura soli]|uniref:DUF2752 domain-containing protein n=1 Tax=Actinomadura soli TaxID=2508997 RepID=A0A5C4J5V7_9ACTN|nr:DUF2752 domain-containing protein [Actinomadura soli]TMQ91938.1 DUF2752 domain-containing protein [Actinomadura soli]